VFIVPSKTAIPELATASQWNPRKYIAAMIIKLTNMDCGMVPNQLTRTINRVKSGKFSVCNVFVIVKSIEKNWELADMKAKTMNVASRNHDTV